MSTPKWEKYYKLITPQHSTKLMQDSQDVSGGTLYASHSWYQRLVQGSSSRMTRYREYDGMDNDVDVARALDTIAEEMTPLNRKTSSHIDIQYHDIDGAISNTTAATIATALRYWSQLHKYDRTLFNIARTTIKFGDCFFRKTNGPVKKWEYINPKNVVAAIVDEYDVTKVVAWQIRVDLKKAQSNVGGIAVSGQQYETEFVDAQEIVRFTLNDDMSESAPFGESILKPVYKSFKQKELLEDAILIYRISRAPERRVFYIDTGKMPPQRTKQYLEQIKNEIKQKKIPTQDANGNGQVESIYNPHCLDLSTEIPLLDGRTLTLSDMIVEYEEGKEMWVYSCNPDTGEMVPGLVSWAGVTRTNADTIKLTFDNGEHLICTPDHKIPVYGKGFVEAKDVLVTDSLIPFNTRREPIQSKKSDYEQVYCNSTKQWKFTHRTVANFMKESSSGNTFTFNDALADATKDTIHHADFNRFNNSPANLVWMNNKDHTQYHSNNNQSLQFNAAMIDIISSILVADLDVSVVQVIDMLNNDTQFMDEWAASNALQSGVDHYKIKVDKFSKRSLDKLLINAGFDNWRHFRSHTIQQMIQSIPEESMSIKFGVLSPSRAKLIRLLIDVIISTSVHNHNILQYFNTNHEAFNTFASLYGEVFNTSITVPNHTQFERIAAIGGYSSFKQMVVELAMFNHRITSIEVVQARDVGTLTIDQDEIFHNYHTFAIKSGIYVKNSTSEDFFFAQRSDGKGSKVETLPGGAGLGELADLEFFQNRVYRGLRIPVSYMATGSGDSNPIFNDGRIGQAYIEELNFADFCMRLQRNIGEVLDEEFKMYLRALNLNIDPTCFSLRLPEPTNFRLYKQQEADTAVLGSLSQADGITFLAKRFALSRFGQLDEDEILRNERLKCEELNISPDDPERFKIIYGTPEGGDDTFGGIGDLGGGDLGGEMSAADDLGDLGGDLGGGEEPLQ